MGIKDLSSEGIPIKKEVTTPDPKLPGSHGEFKFVVRPPIQIAEPEGPLYGRDFSDMPVKITVGKSQYHVHPALLSKDSRFWDDKVRNATGGEIDLPNVTPDVFSLFLQWLYTGEFPGATRYDLPSVFKGPSRLFVHLDGTEDMSMNICAGRNPEFARISPEELRFIETAGHKGEAYHRHLGVVENIRLTFEPALFSYKEQKHRAVENMKQHYGLEFPLKSGYTSAKDAATEHLLLMLLDLTILAQSWGMIRLHDQAINMYRRVERLQGRYCPLSHHIIFVYERSAPGAPLRRLMSDYTQVTARQSKSRAAFFPLFKSHPEFLMDFLERADKPELCHSMVPLLLESRCDAYMLEYWETSGQKWR